MSEQPKDTLTRLAEKVSASFVEQRYELCAEEFETTWGFKTTSNKYFKLSNPDLAAAFRDIIENWAEWDNAKLNVNSEDPDDTLRDFSRAHFSPEGAYKALAEVQRRGFLHLINAVAYSALHDGQFGPEQWQSALTKPDYEAALAQISALSEQARQMSQAAGSSGQPTPKQGKRVTGGDNVLYYGAPGTGKSHDVWERVGTDVSFVTVFHPDMQNSDFVGTLKPGTDGAGNVTYSFRPGPFARAAAYAWAHPAKKVYLVVEELNRAVAAAVFGELFQLLDRSPEGGSRYEVDFPSPEFEKWFHKEAGQSAQRLSLPSNLWLLATMNSADQGVYPLDTAFRRRWRQQYLSIDYAKAPTEPVKVFGDDGGFEVTWRQFVAALNNFLVEKLEIGEDRLIGPRFLDAHDLVGGKLPGKLLIYLWDDLLRHNGRGDLFRPAVKTYGELHDRMLTNKPVFTELFLGRLASDDGSGSGASGPVPE